MSSGNYTAGGPSGSYRPDPETLRTIASAKQDAETINRLERELAEARELIQQITLAWRPTWNSQIALDKRARAWLAATAQEEHDG